MNTLPNIERNYIGGAWVTAECPDWHEVVQPANEEVIGRAPLSSAETTNRAVAAARGALEQFASSARESRLAWFDRLIAVYDRRYEEMAVAISTEMGAPITMSRERQAAIGLRLLKSYREVLSDFVFEVELQGSVVVREPIGVAGLIAPWNWPMNQIVSKVGAALAAGCTMVLKPSIYAPYSAALFTEFVDECGLPEGAFNLVHGDAEAGQTLSRHQDVDIVSFTGSTKVGIQVAIDAAPTVKRVAQELGGKSPCIILPGTDLPTGVSACVAALLLNSGQSCNAPTRLLVHRSEYAQAVELARRAMSTARLGDPFDTATTMGPLSNRNQYVRVQHYIASGVDQGARLVCGGPSIPPGLERGYYTQPTLFADVSTEMVISQEEIFGPVLCMMPFETIDDAIRLANDSDYGLTAYVHAPDKEQGLEVARRLRAGMVHVNGTPAAVAAPFGGYKMSGNGRERGRWGIEEYLETKAVFA